MTNNKIICKICNSDKTKVLYSGTLRNGKYGHRTSEIYNVLQCKKCDTIFINPFPSDLVNFYEGTEYRKKYNETIEIKKFHGDYDKQELEYLVKIGPENLRDTSLADFGAGGGSFLDATYGFIKQGIAIEPAKMYHPTLKKRYKVFSWGRDFVNAKLKVHNATAFDVLEHVQDPKEFLKEIYESLHNNGKLFILVPNHNDILKYLCKNEFNQYDYRTVHLFYFNKKSISYLLKLLGFKKVTVSYHHKYNFSNLLSWLYYKQPMGTETFKYFDNDFNNSYKNEIKRLGMTSHLWIEATK